MPVMEKDLKMIIKPKKRKTMTQLTEYDFRVNCPRNFRWILDRIYLCYGSFDMFIAEFDFEACVLPEDISDYTDEDWQVIADVLSEIQSEQAEVSVFKNCPQSVDPVNY